MKRKAKSQENISDHPVDGAHLQDVLNHLDQGFIVVGPDGRIKARNTTHQKLLGFSDDMVREGQPVEELLLILAENGAFGPGDPGKQAKERAAKFKSGTLSAEEFNLPDGRIIQSKRSPMAGGGMVAVLSDVTEQRATEKALRESETRFRDYAEVGSDWHWEMDADLRFTYFSERHIEVLGIDANELVGKRRQDLSDETVDSEKWRQHLDDLENHRPFRDFRYEMKTTPGETRIVSLNGKPVFDDRKVFQGYRGTGQDVTAQVGASEGLRRSNSVLETTLDATADGLFVISLDRRIIAANRQIKEMWDIPDDILETGDAFALRDWVAKRSVDPDEFVREVEAFYRDPGMRQLTPLRFKDGRIFDRLSQPQYLDGQIVGRVVSIRDVTDQTRSREELQETVSILESTLNSTTDGIMVVEQNRRIAAVNKLFCEFLNVPDRIIESEDGYALRDWMADQLENGAEFVEEVERQYKTPEEGSVMLLKRKDGRVFERHARPQVRNGTVVGRVITIRDVTDQIENERRLHTALELAEDANRAKSEFLANVSHDLRTPLNAILGFSGIMSDQLLGAMENEKYLEYSKDIQSSGQYLLNLVNDLLDISTIEAGKRQLDVERLNLAELIDDCVTAATGQQASNHPPIKVKCPGDGVTITADRRALMQIVLNLISNAVRFTPKSGKVTVSVKPLKTKFVISVADTGKGIPKARLDRITRAFERGQAHPYSTADGTGLGLAIARSLTELHGGDLKITSKVGQGTTVTVSLPR